MDKYKHKTNTIRITINFLEDAGMQVEFFFFF